MTGKPEALALRLAKSIAVMGHVRGDVDSVQAAEELRRQHALIAELTEALQMARTNAWPHLFVETQNQIDAALAKAEAQQ